MKPADTIRIARAVGCRVIEVSDKGGGPPRVELDCASGWDAARLLLALGREDASDPSVRALAAELGTPRAAHEWVTRHVRFEREAGEVFQGAAVTMGKGEGDCDCHARLLLALLTAMGARARLAFLHRGRGPLHVVAQAFDDGAWRWLETTVPGEYGEHPIAAARRTGKIRPDVGGDMLEATMGAIDLETGHAYELRLATGATRDDVTRALAANGFRLVSLWQNASDLPAEWPPSMRDELASPTRWAVAIYEGAPVCLGLPRDFIQDAQERAPVRVRVTAPSGLYVRSAPSTTGARLGLLAPGDELDVIARGFAATDGAPRGWVQVRAGTIEGFVSEEWIGAVDVAGAKSLETESTPVRWMNDGRGGRFTSDLKVYETPRNPNAGSAWWSDRAWDLFLDMADENGIAPHDLLAVSLHESGLQPFILIPFASLTYWGLFQWNAALWNPIMGIDDAAFAAWKKAGAVSQTAEEQLPFARRYWSHMNRYSRGGKGFAGLTPGALYAFNFVPGNVETLRLNGVDLTPDVVLVSNVPGERFYNKSFWDSNPSLRGPDNRIRVSDLDRVVSKVRSMTLYGLALARLNAARARRGQAPLAPSVPGGAGSGKPPPGGGESSSGAAVVAAAVAAGVVGIGAVGLALSRWLRRRRR